MSEDKTNASLTEEQHKLVNYLFAQGIMAERQRIVDLLNSLESDTIIVDDFVKLVNDGV